ncbi:MAG: hypothetical protein IIY16_03670 [Oscillospiraceae bacterium]|nr:hypothetical protein [Oscillospiraceae bacterium]
MESKYCSSYTVLPSACDFSSQLGVANAFAVFMDAATAHAQTLRVGAKDMMDRGLFWLTVKTRIRFHRRPALMEQVTVETWPEPAGKVRCLRNYTIRSGEELLIEGKTEWAVMNLESGRLMPATDIYPKELVHLEETVCDGPFARIREDFSDGVQLGEYRVCATDIDLGGHMNNAAYVRAVMSMFTTAQLCEIEIREMEAHFRASCYEGEVLKICARFPEEGMEIGMLREDGKAALLVLIR